MLSPFASAICDSVSPSLIAYSRGDGVGVGDGAGVGSGVGEGSGVAVAFGIGVAVGSTVIGVSVPSSSTITIGVGSSSI